MDGNGSTNNRWGRGNWPKKVAILSDYLRLPYANGATFACQFLYRELRKRGCEVTVIGPHDPAMRSEDLPERYIAVPSVPLHNHPGVYLPLPLGDVLRKAREWDFDVVLGQTATELMELGLWLRRAKGIPLVCVNTLHLASVYPVVMPDALHHSETAHKIFQRTFLRLAERTSVDVYNDSDGLVVLCKGLEHYWRARGVTSPIHVIPRNVDPRIFDAPAPVDPFPKRMRRGARLVVVCRHTREKEVERLLRIFARWVAPSVPEATLTLVGDGPDHDLFKRFAAELGVADRCWFPGEFPVTEVPKFYRHADLFVYASLSETYGQVVSEALWCGLPVVAFADGMGVSQQVEHDVTGVLVDPTHDHDAADWRFGHAVIALLRNPRKRHALSVVAARHARERCAPERNVDRFFMAFEAARRHADATVRKCLDASRITELTHAVRWFAINGIAYGLGRVRPPALVNRHGRKQPSWNDLLTPLEATADVPHGPAPVRAG
jgi:glycosyltransferase involved in cell wall biosynthesis